MYFVTRGMLTLYSLLRQCFPKILNWIVNPYSVNTWPEREKHHFKLHLIPVQTSLIK